jgi:hypothetical protein
VKTKIRHIKRISNPYGGILFCFNEICRMGIPRLLDKSLGLRPKQAKYKYSDVILSWVYSIMCGSERLEDTKALKHYFSEIPKSLHPSPDAIGRVFKAFATDTTSHESDRSVHQFNINLPLNEVLIDVALKLKTITPNANNIFDYDNVLPECEKFDSRTTYKLYKGYSPGVAFINKHRCT